MKMKVKDSVKLQILVLATIILTFLFVSSLWAIEIGAMAYMNNGYTEGLFGRREARVQYHLGLLFASLSFVLVVILLVCSLFENYKVERR
jgi:hypothetical protein